MRLLVIGRLQSSQQGEQSGPLPTHTVTRWEVGTTIKRATIRGQPHGQGPAAPSGQHLYGCHINTIHVRPLFAVNFDRDVVTVQVFGNRHILKRLPLHYMAPVAGRITDRQEDGFVLFLCAGKGFLSPRVPINRVVSMLEKIGTGFKDQSVRIMRTTIFKEMLGSGRICVSFRLEGPVELLPHCRRKRPHAG